MQDLLGINRNLVNNIAERVGKPKGFYKAIALDALFLVSLSSFGLVSRFFITGTLGIWYILASAGLSSLVLMFHSMMPIGSERRYAMMAFGAFLYSLPFFNFPLWIFASVAGIACLFLMLGTLDARMQIDRSLEIGYTPVFRAVFGKFVTGFCIIGVLLYASVNGIGIPFSESFFAPIYTSSSALVSKFYPSAVLTGSVKEFGDSLAVSEAQSSPEFGKLPRAAQDEVVKQGSKQIIMGLGIKEKDQNMKLSSVAYGWLMDFLNNLRQSVGPYYPMLWSVVFFLLARSFGALMMYILYPLGWLLYESSIAMGFYSIQGESRMKEVIKF